MVTFLTIQLLALHDNCRFPVGKITENTVQNTDCFFGDFAYWVEVNENIYLGY